MQLIKIVVVLLLLSNCETTKTNKQIEMDKNNPEYMTYSKQKNRFEFNGCDLKYNDKPFNIGMNLKEFSNIFGEESESYTTEFYDEGFVKLFWKKKGLEITILNNIVIHIYIYIQSNQWNDKISLLGNKSILFNNYILNQSDRMQDFIKKTNMSFDDFEIDSNGYLQRYTCNNKQLIYDIASPVAYHRIGGGHLYTQGDWKLDNTAIIKYIHVYYND